MAKRTDANTPKLAVKLLQGFMVLVCVGFAVFTLWQAGVNFLRTSPIFRVREVVSQQSLQFIRSRTLDRLIGQSIFDVDIKIVQRRLQAEYPQIDQLRVYRQFPNRIYIDAIRRDPFAVIVSRRQQYVVDRNGAVLALKAPENTRLPLINGIDLRHEPVTGKAMAQPDLTLALSIVQAVRDNPNLEAMPVVSLDLTNLSEIKVLLANQLRVILAEDKIQQKIAMLGIVMSEGKIKPEDVNYIDLRFREPVIGKK